MIVEVIEPQVIRREGGANIDGHLAVMRNGDGSRARDLSGSRR
jgi:hypothetical protein